MFVPVLPATRRHAHKNFPLTTTTTAFVCVYLCTPHTNKTYVAGYIWLQTRGVQSVGQVSLTSQGQGMPWEGSAPAWTDPAAAVPVQRQWGCLLLLPSLLLLVWWAGHCRHSSSRQQTTAEIHKCIRGEGSRWSMVVCRGIIKALEGIDDACCGCMTAVTAVAAVYCCQSLPTCQSSAGAPGCIWSV